MNNDFSRQTITQYLPVIKEIIATAEIDLKESPQLENRKFLQFFFLEKTHSASKIGYAMTIIKNWVDPKKFEVKYLTITKQNEKATWKQLLKELHTHLENYHNDTDVIILTLSKEGIIKRIVLNTEYTQNLSDSGMKIKILNCLSENEGFIKTNLIKKLINSKNVESVSKQIGTLNFSLEHRLKLPKNKHLVESKSGKGYRINPIYNLIVE